MLKNGFKFNLYPQNPNGLLGQIYVEQENVPNWEEISPYRGDFQEWFGTGVTLGGAWKPAHCKARQKVVILVSSI